MAKNFPSSTPTLAYVGEERDKSVISSIFLIIFLSVCKLDLNFLT